MCQVLSSHFIFLEKYQVRPVVHGHIAYLPSFFNHSYHCSDATWGE